MSTYLERSTLHGELVEPPRVQRRSLGPEAGTVRAVRAVVATAWAELWKRTVGGGFERLPDPATHPECWFRLI